MITQKSSWPLIQGRWGRVQGVERKSGRDEFVGKQVIAKPEGRANDVATVEQEVSASSFPLSRDVGVKP